MYYKIKINNIYKYVSRYNQKVSTEYEFRSYDLNPNPNGLKDLSQLFFNYKLYKAFQTLTLKNGMLYGYAHIPHYTDKSNLPNNLGTERVYNTASGRSSNTYASARSSNTYASARSSNTYASVRSPSTYASARSSPHIYGENNSPVYQEVKHPGINIDELLKNKELKQIFIQAIRTYYQKKGETNTDIYNILTKLGLAYKTKPNTPSP
jgi:hypothetical protein